MPKTKKAGTRRRERRVIPVGKAYIQATFNNTIITITDPQGNVIGAKGRLMPPRWPPGKPPGRQWSRD
jgi:ribosomal protein S11